MEDINYLLVEANRLKVGGYVSVSREFYEKLISTVYEANPNGCVKMYNFINSKIEWYKQDGIEYGYPFEYYSEPLLRQQKYLATAGTSAFVDYVYKRASLLDTYRELAFIMFILRVVNPYDYLAHETDVGYVVGRFEVGMFAGGRYTNGSLHLSPSGYARLMLGYIRNASEGVDYGVNPWDFVYHILKKNRCRKLTSVGKLISSELESGHKLGDCNALGVTDAIIDKYTEEVVIMCPILCRLGYLTRDDVVKVIVRMRQDKSKVEYVKFLFNSQDLFDLVNVSGVKYKCSWV